MKRACLLLFLLIPALAFAVGNVQQTTSQLGITNNWVVAFSWTGDASSGTVPVTSALNLSCCQGYYFTQVGIAPGSPSPTAGYNVAILDAGGADILAGAGANLSATTPANFSVPASATPVQGTFRLSITGQSVASAKGTVYVYVAKPGSVNLAAINSQRIALPLPLIDGGSGAGLTAANGGLVYSTSSAMAIAPPGQLGWVPSTNGNNSLAVAGNTGITPDANLFVAETFSTNSQVMVDFLYSSSSVGSDSGAMRSIAYQTGGTGNNRAGEFHVVKTSPAATAATWGLEVGVHSQVAGNGFTDNAGIYMESSDSFLVSGGVRADTAIVIQGNKGWTHAIQFYDIDAAILFDIDQYGAMNSLSGLGYTKFNGNTQGAYPPYNTVKSALGWNFSGGGGEVDWFNPQNTGTARGFSWYQQTGASAATLLGSLDSSGNFSAATLISTATASPASGSACTAGRLAWDTGFFYVCTASGAWKRVALTGGY